MNKASESGSGLESGSEAVPQSASRMDRDDQAIHLLCVEWRNWLMSRRLYTMSTKLEGVLARLQPSKNVAIPDAALSAELSFLNMAILGMEDTKDKAAFLAFYKYRIKNIKRYAGITNVSRQTFYKNVKRFRKAAYMRAKFLQRVHEANQSQQAGIKLDDKFMVD